MRHSLDTAAHVTTVIEVDMTGVVNLRKQWKPEFQARHGVNLTYIPFIATATIEAIGAWPWVNAEVQGESAHHQEVREPGHGRRRRRRQGPDGAGHPPGRGEEPGRPVPRSVIEMAEKARTKTLSPDEMAGGTFTITNPGVFGALIGTPIIPEGQVAILDVEAIVKRPDGRHRRPRQRRDRHPAHDVPVPVATTTGWWTAPTLPSSCSGSRATSRAGTRRRSACEPYAPSMTARGVYLYEMGLVPYRRGTVGDDGARRRTHPGRDPRHRDAARA